MLRIKGQKEVEPEKTDLRRVRKIEDYKVTEGKGGIMRRM